MTQEAHKAVVYKEETTVDGRIVELIYRHLFGKFLSKIVVENLDKNCFEIVPWREWLSGHPPFSVGQDVKLTYVPPVEVSGGTPLSARITKIESDCVSLYLDDEYLDQDFTRRRDKEEYWLHG